MQRFVVEGGTPLEGSLTVNGAKNAVLPILAASLLSKEEIVLEQAPQLEDVFVMCEVLRHFGSEIKREGNTFIIRTPAIVANTAPEALMKRMRASNLILGALLSRSGEVALPFPGGCAIGTRPMNYHLQALSALGANLCDKGACIQAKASRLRGADICLDFPSVGATENAIMGAVLAKGTTTIRNAAREPEVADLIAFLNKMGAQIDGAGCGVISIKGVEKLHGAQHRIMPDRIEAGTLMVAGAISEGDILLKGIGMQEMAAVAAKLSAAGVRIQAERNGIRIRAKGRPRATDIRTMPYPGFPTDMQPQFMALMARAEGASVISETIFENRFRHVPEMRRMNADIRVIGDSAIVYGREHICGACVETPDLRAGAALVLLALAADGRTVIEQIHYIDRGYQNLEYSLSALGASIQREAAEPETEMKGLPRRTTGELVPAEISQF